MVPAYEKSRLQAIVAVVYFLFQTYAYLAIVV